MPTEALCFVFDKTSSNTNVIEKAFCFLQWLCEQSIPHNFLLSLDRSKSGILKMFIFARENHLVVKNVFDLNAAFCELSGYFPIGGNQCSILSKGVNVISIIFR